MSILPSNSRRWISLLLLPLKVFVVVAPISLAIVRQVLAHEYPDTQRFQGSFWFTHVAGCIAYACILCLLAFSVAAVIQSRIGFRRDSLVSAIYTAVAFVAVVFIFFSYLLLSSK